MTLSVFPIYSDINLPMQRLDVSADFPHLELMNSATQLCRMVFITQGSLRLMPNATYFYSVHRHLHPFLLDTPSQRRYIWYTGPATNGPKTAQFMSICLNSAS
jgi:hypothetical protein